MRDHRRHHWRPAGGRPVPGACLPWLSPFRGRDYLWTRNRRIVTAPDRVLSSGSRSIRARPGGEKKGMPSPNRTGRTYTRISSTSSRRRAWTGHVGAEDFEVLAGRGARKEAPRAKAQTRRLGATPGATRMNGLAILRTCTDKPASSRPRSRTDLNGPRRPHRYLRVSRSVPLAGLTGEGQPKAHAANLLTQGLPPNRLTKSSWEGRAARPMPRAGRYQPDRVEPATPRRRGSDHPELRSKSTTCCLLYSMAIIMPLPQLECPPRPPSPGRRKR